MVPRENIFIINYWINDFQLVGALHKSQSSVFIYVMCDKELKKIVEFKFQIIAKHIFLYLVYPNKMKYSQYYIEEISF